MAQIIDGKKISAAVRGEIAKETKQFVDEHGFAPGLTVIIVGEDPASQVYVRNKKRACEEVGFASRVIEMPEQTTEEELLSVIDGLVKDDMVHGILVQLPLPKHISEEAILRAIPPHKDVDAFHPHNVARIMIGDYDFVPCTPAGIMEMLAYENIDVCGKNCVVIGRSNIVGKPMGMLLLHKNGTVTICHSKTQNLKEIYIYANLLKYQKTGMYIL